LPNSHFEPIGPVGGEVDFKDGELPPYVIPGSPEEKNWWASHPAGHKLLKHGGFDTGSTEAHRHAQKGEIAKLKEVLDANPKMVNKRDSNGWTPLHEAVRDGSLEVIEFLLDRGAEVNVRTGARADGASPLFLAWEYHRENPDDTEQSDVEALLIRRGAQFVAPLGHEDEIDYDEEEDDEEGYEEDDEGEL
jgi:hypothetical protein